MIDLICLIFNLYIFFQVKDNPHFENDIERNSSDDEDKSTVQGDPITAVDEDVETFKVDVGPIWVSDSY